MLSTQVVHEPSIGSLTYDEEIRDCTLDEVCVVRVGDRVLVLPIDAELAAGSGFEVIEIDSTYLTSIGVKPRPSETAQHQRSVSVEHEAADGNADGANAVDEQAVDEQAVDGISVVANAVDEQAVGADVTGSAPFALLPTLEPVSLSAVEAGSLPTVEQASLPALEPVSLPTAGEPLVGRTAWSDSHSLHQEDESMIGTLGDTASADAASIDTAPVDTASVGTEHDRRLPTPWADALQDTYISAPSTATAETLTGATPSSPASGVAPVHSPIAAQLVDWSVLDAVVEPARPLDVASASRDDGLGLSPVGWPEIDRRAPEILDTAPAAFNPLARPNPAAQPTNRSGDRSDGLAQASAPFAPSNLAPAAGSAPAGIPDASTAVNPPTSSPTPASSSAPAISAPASSIEALATTLSTSTPATVTSPTANVVSAPVDRTATGPSEDALGASPSAPLAAVPSVETATFASVVASQLVISGSGDVDGDAHSISFVLAPGEAMEIRGGDDAEVLRLFRTLAGFVAPASGSLDVDGEERSALAAPERARREALFSGALFDSAVLIPERSVAANLEIPLLAAGIAPATAAAMTASRLETMGLSVLGPHRIDFLSSDLRVLVGAARSLIMPSPLVVIAMDTRVLADETVKWLHALVDQARRGGAAVVYRSNDPRFGFDGGRAVVLSNGVLAPIGNSR